MAQTIVGWQLLRLSQSTWGVVGIEDRTPVSHASARGLHLVVDASSLTLEQGVKGQEPESHETSGGLESGMVAGADGRLLQWTAVRK